MGALLADRPEQETGEPAVPARSDDEEIAGRDCMNQDVDGAALDAWRSILRRSPSASTSAITW
jgi:hypothetical protein